MSYHWPGAFIFTSQDYCQQKPVYYIFTCLDLPKLIHAYMYYLPIYPGRLEPCEAQYLNKLILIPRTGTQFSLKSGVWVSDLKKAESIGGRFRYPMATS